MSNERFADRLNLALDYLGFPPKDQGRILQLAELMGLSKSGAGTWVTGKACPPASKYQALAKQLKVRAEWLKSGDGPMMEPLPVYTASEFLSPSKSPIQTISTNLPIIHDLFAIQLDSDAMFPRFSKGNIVVFDPNKEPEDGDFVFINLNNHPAPLFRQLILGNGTFYLEAYNPKFDRLILTDTSKVLGSMVQAIINFF